MCLMKNHIAAFGLSLLIAAPAFAFDVNGKGQDSLLGGDANVCHREPWRCTKNPERAEREYYRDRYHREVDRRARDWDRRHYRDWND
jgi:hypothetical protein